MRWRKLGLLHVPSGQQAWARSHAMLPTPVPLDDERLRIFVGHLDERQVGRIGYVDVALSNPQRPLAVADEPVLDIGEPGLFDDNGVIPCCAVRSGERLRMYYAGFQLQEKIPYTIFTGLAETKSVGAPFERITPTPVLDRSDQELFFRAAPFVLQQNGRWRMWYIGGTGWTDDGHGKMIPLYSMKYAESDDGIVWPSAGIECLTPQEPDEVGFGRPFIVQQGARLRMLYAIRRRSGYSLGYAESSDGLAWTRKDDEAGIACSPDGWDSEMICYAAVFPARDKWLMFYNGNGYGRTGVGFAVADAD